MLKKLYVQNVALIEKAEISFGRGLNVLSGETGAGKSVILDTVNFVLGAKADKAMIRSGENECFVRAEFEVDEGDRAFEILKELDVEPETTILLSRKFSLDGKGSIKVNGVPVTAGMLKTLTSCLVDVHGQSEHFFLLKEENQLRTLDSLCGEPLKNKKEELKKALEEFRAVKKSLAAFNGDARERAKRLDILSFQIDEISSAALTEGEEEALKEKREKIINSEKIFSALRGGADALSSDGGALDSLKQAKRLLSSVERYAKEYEELAERLEGILSDAEDVGELLSDKAEEFSFDEGEAEEVENRLDLIKSLKTKYGATVQEILSYAEEAKREKELLSNCDEEVARLTAAKEKIEEKIYSISLAMSEIRKRRAEVFSKNVVEELKSLNISSPAFQISFEPFSREDVTEANENGLDKVCFLFSANAGEPVKPLSKIISGGEMSRFMLALKTELKGVNGISTYIFDEIDAGISGKTALVVAEKMAKISLGTQVICVSHLPQMASMSDTSLLIQKREEDGKTISSVTALNEEGKIKETVRLLGGDEGDEFAFRHAEEMIKSADSYKKSLSAN